MSAGDLLETSVQRLLAEACTSEDVRRADGTWPGELWRALADAQLPWISIPEALGGAGGDLGDLVAVIRLSAASAAPVPLVETGLLAGWLLANVDIPLPEGPMSVGGTLPGDSLTTASTSDGLMVTGTLRRVPWGRDVERVVTLLEIDGRAHVASLRSDQFRLDEHRNLAGEPRDDVIVDGLALAAVEHAPAPEHVNRDELARRGALGRAVQMAGAMERVRSMTVEYAHQREQFGRPLARFQAVQHLLVELAAEAAAARTAADVAVQLLSAGSASREAMVAKVVADRAATVVTRNAHQVHGAMGVTDEHDLQLFTRRLWAWQAEFGTGAVWARRLGADLLSAGPDALWASISTGLVGSARP